VRTALSDAQVTITTTAASSSPPLLDQVRQLALARGDKEATAHAFVAWIRQFILFHHKRHPRELALPEIGWQRRASKTIILTAKLPGCKKGPGP
jgi:hypothetical protein